MALEESLIIDIESIDQESSTSAPKQDISTALEPTLATSKNPNRDLNPKNSFTAITVKGKRITFSEKDINISRHPQTIAELYSFHSYLRDYLQTEKTGPGSLSLRKHDYNLVSKLAQDSKLDLDGIAVDIRDYLCPKIYLEAFSTNQNEVLPLVSIKNTIELISTRVNYCPPKPLNHSLEPAKAGYYPQDIWRWETNDISCFSTEIQTLVKSRRTRREVAKQEIKTLLAEYEDISPLKVSNDTVVEVSISPDIEIVDNNSISQDVENEAVSFNKNDTSAHQGKVQTRLFGFFEKSASELLLASTNVVYSGKNSSEASDIPKVKVSASKESFKDRIRPFYVKPNTTVAQQNYHSCAYSIDTLINKVGIDSDVDINPASCSIQQESIKTNLIKSWKLASSKVACAKDKSKTNTFASSVSLTSQVIDVEIVDQVEGKLLPRKIIYFSESLRPCYYGTWSRKPKHVDGRNPLALETNPNIINYDVDSSEEWEALDEEGEELKSDEEDDEDEFDDLDGDDGWIVNADAIHEHSSSDSEENDQENEKKVGLYVDDESDDEDDSDFDVNNPLHIDPDKTGVADLSGGDSDSGEVSDFEQEMDLDEEVDLDKTAFKADVADNEPRFIMPKRKPKLKHNPSPNLNSSIDANREISCGNKSKQVSKSYANKGSIQKRLVTPLNPVIIGPIFPGFANKDQNQVLASFPVVWFPKPSAPEASKMGMHWDLTTYTDHDGSVNGNGKFGRLELNKDVNDVSRLKQDPKPAESQVRKYILTKRDLTKMIKIIHMSPLSLKILTEKLKQGFPLASKLQIQAVIQDNAVKEKRNSCKRPRWYVNEKWLRNPPKKKRLAPTQASNNRVEVVDLDAIQGSFKPNSRIFGSGSGGTGEREGVEKANTKSDKPEVSKEKDSKKSIPGPLLAFFQKT